MTQITTYLAIYIVSIIWCKWVVTLSEKGSKDDYGIFSKEFLIAVLSWIPLLNSFIAVITTYEILGNIYVSWKVKRSIKKMLKKIADKHKGEQVADDIKNIINQL